ncbi:MAG: transglutaminase-like domain-containing protein [Methanobacteriaceae archaeon]|nr:transglutaminase-like domain-containing protein [Methanobacteriaceae archaeon]
MEDKTRIILGVCFSIIFICFLVWYSGASVVDEDYLNNVQESISNVQINTSNINFNNLFNNTAEEGAFVKEHINESQFQPGLNEKENISDPSKYLQSGGSSAITKIVQAKADKLTENCTNDWDKASALFNFTRSIKYTPFYVGSKYGATKTLSADKANCCDHANAIVALLRASGIPARYVMQSDCYFYDYNLSAGHVWAQVYLDGTWYSVDATGEHNEIGNILNWNVSNPNPVRYAVFN